MWSGERALSHDVLQPTSLFISFFLEIARVFFHTLYDLLLGRTLQWKKLFSGNCTEVTRKEIKIIRKTYLVRM